MKTAIMIVEDEGLIALDLKKRLEQFGYAVPAIADNAEEALAGVENFHPNLVLMDIHLRGDQDGISVAEQIRRRFHLPVMFVTAHADAETLQRARITEPFGYIVKPFHSVDFRAQIEIALWKHKMEQKLRASEAWLSTIVRNVADALIATDHEGNVVLMNDVAAQLTGWGVDECRGKPLLDVFEVFDETTDLPVVHPLETVFDGRELASEAKTYRLLKRGTSELTFVETQFSANRDGDRLLGVIVVFRDITERRREEERNRQLQKTNALALLAIGLGRELAESQRGMDASVNELVTVSHGHAVSLLADIYERSAHQQSIVQQLIGLGRTDPGEPQVLDLNEFLKELEPKFRKILGIRGSLQMNLEPGIPSIKADPRELRENVLRLVVDARKAMPDGGHVDIATRAGGGGKAGRRVQLEIRDSGKCLRPGTKERVFDPYYQSRAGMGNPGFSLALVYHFVALNGGSIDVESNNAEGTAYVLSFPAAVASYLPEGVPVPVTVSVG